ncbi:MAG: hypothetical protein GY810_08945 [Aureispira sp.]|nr:hypothetical protein [Aureispira sp.]
MDWDIVIKAFGMLIGLVGTVYQFKRFDPRKRDKLKTDLEILNLLDPESPEFEKLKIYTEYEIDELYGNTTERRENKQFIKKPGDFVFGLVLFLGFFVWTYILYNNAGGFTWYMLITGFFAFAGAGNIIIGLEGDKK